MGTTISATFDDMFVWHGLPGIVICDDIKYAAVLTNLDGELAMIRVPYDERDDDRQYKLAGEQGVFECLHNDSPVVQPEMTLILSLTHKCNGGCRYCFLDSRAHGPSMPSQILRCAMRKGAEIAKDRLLTIAAFGGEPGLELGLLSEMIDYATRLQHEYSMAGLQYAITTNGLLNENVISLLCQHGFKVSLSMDGLPHVQNYQRPVSNGSASYAWVERTLAALIASGLDIKIRATVTAFSVGLMPDIVRHLHSLGVNKVHFEPVTGGGRADSCAPDLLPPDVDEFIDKLKESIETAAMLGGIDVICFPYMNLMFSPTVFCDGSIQNRLVVSPTGLLSSCVEVQREDHPMYKHLGLGFYDHASDSLVITAEARRRACRGCAVIQDNRSCHTCPCVFFCGGGCPTRNYRGSGDTDVVDGYRCRIVKGTIPYVLARMYESTFGDGIAD